MKKQISIIGGGPSALLLAAFLDETKFEVTIYEKNKSGGRKFLVAGNGGFNLTHSEPISEMIERYTPNDFLKESLLSFSNTDLQDWLREIGVSTFVGSSKRVYPEPDVKPIEVLKAVLGVLGQKQVMMAYNCNWIGWNRANQPIFENGEELMTDYTVFALGAGSWKITGSDGNWLNKFKEKSVEVLPFQPSNCAYQVNWSSDIINKYAGEPLKNISITCGDKTQKGEVVVTKFGLEGNAIYALSPQIRKGLNEESKSTITIDLKPSLSIDTIVQKIKNSKRSKITDILKKDLKLSAVQLVLVKAYVSKKDFLDVSKLAQCIKQLNIQIVGFDHLDKAISTVGGVSLNAVDANYQLKKLPNQYCIGEMLNWDAPTGGYLLQACFSMVVGLANHFNAVN